VSADPNVDVVSPLPAFDEREVEASLRPTHLEEFVARDGSLTVPGVARVVQAVAPPH